MAGMTPQAPEEAPEEEMEDGEAATPEEQETYEEFVLSCFALIYERSGEKGQVRGNVVKLLDEDPSDLMAVLGSVEELQEFSAPVAVAATAVLIASEIVRRAEEEGIALDDAIVFHGGKELVEELVQVSAGLGKPLDQDETNKAFLMAADLYREVSVADGRVDVEELKAQFEGIVQADKEGRLGEVLPELQKVNDAAAMDQAAAEEEAAAEGVGMAPKGVN